VARTRQALLDAALRLFADQGYDETTTEEIAEAARVSPRTFFRYFPTKESVLLLGEYDFTRSFTGQFLAQPGGTADLTAARDSCVLLAPGLTRLRERIRRYLTAVESSATLRGREVSSHREGTSSVARAVAGRRGLAAPDDECTLFAEVVMLVIQRVLSRWALRGEGTDLGQAFVTEFDRLSRLKGSQ
jgi:AcrR family transcriptional regulator